MRLRPLDENRRGHAQCCATATYERMLHDLQPGLNECAVHPAQGAKATIRRPSLYRCRGRAAPIDPRTASPNRVSRILAVTVGALSGSPSGATSASGAGGTSRRWQPWSLACPGSRSIRPKRPPTCTESARSRERCARVPQCWRCPSWVTRPLSPRLWSKPGSGPSSLADEVSVEGLRASLDELIAWYKRPPRPPQKLPRRWLL